MAINGIKPQRVLILYSTMGKHLEFEIAREAFIGRNRQGNDNYNTKLISYEQLSSTHNLMDAGFDIVVVSEANQSILDEVSKQIMFRLCRSSSRVLVLGTGILPIVKLGLYHEYILPYCAECEAELNELTNITFDTDLRYTLEGNKYISGNGVAAIDLILYQLSCDLTLANVYELGLRFGMAKERIDSTLKVLKAALDSSPRMNKVLQWAESNLELIDSIELLAEKSFLSRRSFDRHFKAIVGMSAKQWLTEQRVLRAKEFLKTSELGIEEIAGATGFGSSNNLRNCFQRIDGCSPTEYRRNTQFSMY